MLVNGIGNSVGDPWGSNVTGKARGGRAHNGTDHRCKATVHHKLLPASALYEWLALDPALRALLKIPGRGSAAF